VAVGFPVGCTVGTLESGTPVGTKVGDSSGEEVDSATDVVGLGTELSVVGGNGSVEVVVSSGSVNVGKGSGSETLVKNSGSDDGPVVDVSCMVVSPSVGFVGTGSTTVGSRVGSTLLVSVIEVDVGVGVSGSDVDSTSVVGACCVLVEVVSRMEELMMSVPVPSVEVDSRLVGVTGASVDMVELVRSGSLPVGSTSPTSDVLVSVLKVTVVFWNGGLVRVVKVFVRVSRGRVEGSPGLVLLPGGSIEDSLVGSVVGATVGSTVGSSVGSDVVSEVGPRVTSVVGSGSGSSSVVVSSGMSVGGESEMVVKKVGSTGMMTLEVGVVKVGDGSRSEGSMVRVREVSVSN
jgi:hypothetical protein